MTGKRRERRREQAIAAHTEALKRLSALRAEKDELANRMFALTDVEAREDAKRQWREASRREETLRDDVYSTSEALNEFYPERKRKSPRRRAEMGRRTRQRF